MTDQLKRGEVWLADLNPTQGSEQAGIRPVIIFQSDIVSQFSSLIRQLGQLNPETITELEDVVLLTLGYEL